MPPVGQVDVVGGVELIDRDGVHGPPGGQVLGHHLLGPLLKGTLVALLAAENVVQHLRRGLTFIVVVQHHRIAALTQVVGSGTGGGLEGRDSLFFLMAPFGAGERFMLKNQEEPPGDGFAGTQLADQAQIVLLKHPAVGVRLPLQLPAHRLHMAVNVRPLGQHLELHLHRRNFQVADKGVDNAALFLGAAQQEVDRHHLQNLHIAVVPGVDDTMLDGFHRHIVRQRIEGLYLRGQECLEPVYFPLLEIHLQPVPAFGGLVVVLLGDAVAPAGEHTLFSAVCTVPVQRPPVAEEAEKLKDELGQAAAANADQGHQHQRQGGQAQDNDTGCEGKGQL